MVLEEIVLDPHLDHILYAPYGWLEGSSFPKAADEHGVTLFNASAWSPEEHERVKAEIKETPSRPSQNRVVLVGTGVDAQRWSRELEGEWKVITHQAIDVFPTLDPELTRHLDLSQVNQLLPSYGKEAVSDKTYVRGSKATAEILLQELYGIDPGRLQTVEGLLESALSLHLRGASLHPTWVEAVGDDFPSLDSVNVPPRKS